MNSRQACRGPPEYKVRELQARETQTRHLSLLDIVNIINELPEETHTGLGLFLSVAV